MNRRGFALALALMGASVGVKVPRKVEEDIKSFAERDKIVADITKKKPLVYNFKDVIITINGRAVDGWDGKL